jgi:enoyl-CoA hydratase/carnithine racemase
MLKNSALSKFIYNKSNYSSFSLAKKFFCVSPSQIPENYTTIKASIHDSNVGLIQLWRPEKKNALNSILIKELNHALLSFEKNQKIGAIVLCGDKEFFAAGADIKEMSEKTFSQAYESSMLEEWNYITKIRYHFIYLRINFSF